MPVILLSGFDAWGHHLVNTSWQAVEAADPALPEGWTLRKVRLPVSWTQAWPRLLDAWSEDVAAVVAFGMAEGAQGLRLEQRATNVVRPDAADVDGASPESGTVQADGPSVYASSLPLAAIAETLRSVRIAADPSSDCGDYLCNFLFYRLMHRVEAEGLPLPAGFVHVPSLAADDLTGREALARAVALTCETLVDHIGSMRYDDSSN